MVFFTSILVIAILYYLQSDGLIYATIVALVSELINIFLTHTLTKSVENKMKLRHRRAVEGYIKKIKSNKKTIAELEQLQEKAADKIYKANGRIKELEETLEQYQAELEKFAQPVQEPTEQPPEVPTSEDPKDYKDHLPDGSQKKPHRR